MLPNQVKEFSAENCPNGSLAKFAKLHTYPYKFVACPPNRYKLSLWVIFEELPFCHDMPRLCVPWKRLHCEPRNINDS